jgi:hypothetical protein
MANEQHARETAKFSSPGVPAILGGLKKRKNKIEIIRTRYGA